MESWVNFGGKEGHTGVQHSAELGFKLGTLWLEGRDLTTAPTTPLLSLFCSQSRRRERTKQDGRIYRIPSKCGKVYMGKTGRPRQDRIQEDDWDTQPAYTWTPADLKHHLKTGQFNDSGMR